jgi:hypothetical protein
MGKALVILAMLKVIALVQKEIAEMAKQSSKPDILPDRLRCDPGPYLRGDGTPRKGSSKGSSSKSDSNETKPHGKKAIRRLDKASRGKVDKFAMGGGAFHKLTPSKHKPHVSVNVVHMDNRRGLARPRVGMGMPLGAAPVPPVGAVPPVGGLPPMPRPPGMMRGGRAYAFGGGLPVQAAPQAQAALAARPALPMQAQAARPFKKGGRVGGGAGSGLGRLNRLTSQAMNNK